MNRLKEKAPESKPMVDQRTRIVAAVLNALKLPPGFA